MGCHTAQLGEECYGEVLAALSDRQFSDNTTFVEVQAMLNRTRNSTTCPLPCGLCRAAVPGDQCFEGVRWAMQHGIEISPEDYPGLTPESSFEDVQALLHSRNLER